MVSFYVALFTFYDTTIQLPFQVYEDGVEHYIDQE